LAKAPRGEAAGVLHQLELKATAAPARPKSAAAAVTTGVSRTRRDHGVNPVDLRPIDLRHAVILLLSSDPA
jgi:hypothetical protein